MPQGLRATDSRTRRRVTTLPRPNQIIFIGDSGTGKTHLLTGLAVAACRQKRRVRFATAAALINELVEAKHQLQLGRALARWARYDLIALDEVGYVPLAEVGAEFLFQVIAERAEKAAVIVTTNLPFSEWTQVIPNARLCKALLDRITDRAHIIETGTESLPLSQDHRAPQEPSSGGQSVRLTEVARGNASPRAPPNQQLRIVNDECENQKMKTRGWAKCEYQSGPDRIVKSTLWVSACEEALGMKPGEATGACRANDSRLAISRSRGPHSMGPWPS